MRKLLTGLVLSGLLLSPTAGPTAVTATSGRGVQAVVPVADKDDPRILKKVADFIKKHPKIVDTPVTRDALYEMFKGLGRKAKAATDIYERWKYLGAKAEHRWLLRLLRDPAVEEVFPISDRKRSDPDLEPPEWLSEKEAAEWRRRAAEEAKTLRRGRAPDFVVRVREPHGKGPKRKGSGLRAGTRRLARVEVTTLTTPKFQVNKRGEVLKLNGWQLIAKAKQKLKELKTRGREPNQLRSPLALNWRGSLWKVVPSGGDIIVVASHVDDVDELNELIQDEHVQDLKDYVRAQFPRRRHRLETWTRVSFATSQGDPAVSLAWHRGEWVVQRGSDIGAGQRVRHAPGIPPRTPDEPKPQQKPQQLAKETAHRLMSPTGGTEPKEEEDASEEPEQTSETHAARGVCRVPQPAPRPAPGVGRAPWGPLAPAVDDCPGSDEAAQALAEGLTQPGGVDFSSLGLRYLALGEGETDGVDFAFHADKVKGRSRGDGIESATQASDAFFVWLALRPSAFTVNLKPNERDQIMDPKFARTEAGRILLEADLALKKKAAWTIHPRTAVGRRFWDAIGTNCVPTFRLWITPGVAKVREDGDSLYILDAPLKVRQEEWEYRPGPGDPQRPGMGQCVDQSPALADRIHREYRRIVLPALTKAVNKDKEFADLRRVYLSRVAAEWYRERSKEEETRFAGIIDSGNIKRWVADDDWRPVDTFRKFLRSWTQGEYTATIRSEGTYRWTITVGGVDFGYVGQDDVGAKAFQRRWGDMGDGVRRALANGGAGTGGEHWVGGRSRVDPEVLAKEFPSSAARDSDDSALGLSSRQLLVIALVGGGVLFVGFGVVRAIRSRPTAGQE